MEATFIQSTRTQRFLKIIETLSCWYSLDSSHWVLLYEYPFARCFSYFSSFLASFCIGQISHQQHEGEKLLGVLRGDFGWFGCRNDIQTSPWLRLYVTPARCQLTILPPSVPHHRILPVRQCPHPSGRWNQHQNTQHLPSATPPSSPVSYSYSSQIYKRIRK